MNEEDYIGGQAAAIDLYDTFNPRTKVILMKDE